MPMPEGITPKIDEVNILLDEMKKIANPEKQDEILNLQKELNEIQKQLLVIEQNRYKRSKQSSASRKRKEAAVVEEHNQYLEELKELELVSEHRALELFDESNNIIEEITEGVKSNEESTTELIEQATEVAKKSEELVEEAKKATDEVIDAVKLIPPSLPVPASPLPVPDPFSSPSSKRSRRPSVSSTDKIVGQLVDNVVGPLKLISDPLKDLTGIDFVDKLSTGISSIFKKDKKDDSDFLTRKVSPTKDALKQFGIIGASALFITNTLGKVLGKSGNSEDGSDIDLHGGALSAVKGLGPALLKGAGIASLAGGILWGVIDGIIAVGKADEWGVSKISAGIGGFLGGTGEGGDIKDAFANAGKFALTGAGIGMLAGGPIGALAGGLIGAVIGGVLGWIGGENIALFFDGVGAWFKEQVANVKNWLGENSEAIQAVKDSVLGVLTTMFGPMIDGVKSVFSGLVFRFNNIKEILGDDDKSFWEKVKSIGGQVIMGIIEVPYNYVKGGLASLFGDRWKTMGDILGDDETSIWEKIGGIGKEVFSGLIDRLGSFVGGVMSLADNFIKLILNDEWEAKYESIKTSMKEWLSLIIDPYIGGIKGLFTGWKDRFTNITDILGDEEISVWEKVKGIGKEIILGIVEGPYNAISGWLDGLVKNEKFQEIKDTMTGWFSGIGEKISNWGWGLLPAPLQGALQSIGLRLTKEVKESTTPTPDDMTYYTNATYGQSVIPVPETIGTNQGVVDNYRAFYNQDKTIESKTIPQREASEEEKGFFKSLGSWFKSLNTSSTNDVGAHQDMVNRYRPVNDAIIYKDGNVFKPSPDDHIIATKDFPVVETRASREMMNQVNNQYFQPQESQESLKKFDAMISLLDRVARGVEKGMGGTIIQNTMNQGFSFDSLRMGT